MITEEHSTHLPQEHTSSGNAHVLRTAATLCGWVLTQSTILLCFSEEEAGAESDVYVVAGGQQKDIALAEAQLVTEGPAQTKDANKHGDVIEES